MTQWKIACGPETITVEQDAVIATADALAAKHNAKPVVTKIENPADLALKLASEQNVNTARIIADKTELRKNGFSLQPGFFADGTELYQVGTDNAAQHRKDFDDMPSASDALHKLVQTVKAENRHDVNIDDLAKVSMLPNGDLFRGKGVLGLESGASVALATRMGIPNAAYMAACWPELRSMNWNAWAKQLSSREGYEANPVVLRTRGNGRKQVFGVVSPRYGAMDVDLIANAIDRSLSSYKGAKAVVTYDGVKSRIEVLFHTTVKPEHQAVGEVFRAGVIVGTDDTGGGSAWVQSSAWFVLCKNYTYTNAGQPVASIRHIGDVDRLTTRFREAFKAGLNKFDHFLKTWGYAQNENVIQTCKDDEIIGLPVSVALPGLFRGIMDRELVVVKGRTEDNVERLLKHWEDDNSSAKKVAETSRASIVNAFTRFAHKDVGNPFETSEIERAASALLYSSKPLPYLPAKR